MAEPGREPVDRDKRTTLRRFAALGAASPLAAFVGSSSESDARSAIAGYVSSTPGAHFSKIRDDLSLGTGETQHHLRRLVDAGAIESHMDGEYRRYFPEGRFSAFERRALGYLRRETPRGMLIALLSEPTTTGSAIAERLDVSTATVSNTAADLEEAGLLARNEGYAIERPETLISLLVRYADSFDERTVRFASRADELIRYDP
ncbi:helix-turn-helix domain protein [Halalkalicoccus paucihalophilus]|jgi:predicted transcriptional regulator|uniref:Helix-turn-helix domain protein n=1 Tax=Halalkalicoccus paucihalophilus TaxID=1008153 RepID=A0A151AIN6_9EURY|nr:MarR family transcriptional regulator [Halalkalicoccus paucihalophilus]KYH27529.1 helix-turn-helix domain protein [Halalkalicoccus paucihalophilus]